MTDINSLVIGDMMGLPKKPRKPKKKTDWRDGQQRRAALDGFLEENVTKYLGPTGLDKRIAALGMMNPVYDMEQAGQNAQRVAQGDMRAIVPMVTDMATVVAPAAAITKAGGKAANALVESILGFGAPAREGATDAAQRFAMDEAGNIPAVSTLTPAQQQAQDILDFLKAGRASEVTDNMMAAADDMYLYQNYDLPMDEASRMARARGMGFDTDVYHGTETSGIQGFDGGLNTSEGGNGVSFLSSEASTANSYAPYKPSFSNPNVAFGEPNVMPLRVRSANYRQDGFKGKMPSADAPDSEWQSYISDVEKWNARFPDSDMKSNMMEWGIKKARQEGQDGAVFRELIDDRIDSQFSMPSDVYANIDPANIRSRFARFDPRLKHLRNLSAGLGGLMMMPQEDQQ